jgi:sensor histidine kinase regulating citrate/malate metabolism
MKRFQDISFRSKLFVLMVPLLIIPIVVMALSQLYMLSANLEEEIIAELSQVAESVIRTCEVAKTLDQNTGKALVSEKIKAIKIHEKGYVFCMDSTGTLVVHHKSEGKNLRGQSHIDEMLEKRNGTIKYRSVTSGKDRIVAYTYFQPFDWIVAAGINASEFSGQIRKAVYVACGIILVMCVIGFMMILRFSKSTCENNSMQACLLYPSLYYCDNTLL